MRPATVSMVAADGGGGVVLAPARDVGHALAGTSSPGPAHTMQVTVSTSTSACARPCARSRCRARGVPARAFSASGRVTVAMSRSDRWSASKTVGTRRSLNDGTTQPLPAGRLQLRAQRDGLLQRSSLDLMALGASATTNARSARPAPGGELFGDVYAQCGWFGVARG